MLKLNCINLHTNIGYHFGLSNSLVQIWQRIPAINNKWRTDKHTQASYCFSFTLFLIIDPSGPRTDWSWTKGTELPDGMLQCKLRRTERLPKSGICFISNSLCCNFNNCRLRYWSFGTDTKIIPLTLSVEIKEMTGIKVAFVLFVEIKNKE